jgi:hypothetical protein
MHHYIRGNAPAEEDQHFILATDGSGHDATGDSVGSAWTLRCHALKPESPGAPDYWRGCSGTTNGTVQRGELMALLDGLHQLTLLYNIHEHKDLERVAGCSLKLLSEFPPNRRVKVLWTSDRENLVLSAALGPDGHPFYTRRGDMDLWARFDFYATWVQITPRHVPRNSEKDMEWADGTAGAVRDFFVMMRRNAAQEDKAQLIAPELKRTTAMYCIGEEGEDRAFWYGPVNDINLVGATLGKSVKSTIFKVTPKTCKAMFKWDMDTQVWGSCTKT